MKLRCLIGHIGYGGVVCATDDIFDVDNDVVANSLISDGDAEEVIDEVRVPDVESVDASSVGDDPTSTKVSKSTNAARKKAVIKK